MDGILLVDKPTGLSSFDVIRQLKAVLSGKFETRNWQLETNANSSSQIPIPKLGHAGTLDPLATGLLIILIGKACKQADQFLKLDKSYTAELTLGATSNTDDAEGTIVTSNSKLVTGEPKKEDIKEVLVQFVGEIEQVPPQHSAIKVGGKRAYKLARSGQSVELKPRLVTVSQLRITSYQFPILQIKTSVSSGTYIRSLARDIGRQLGCGAYLSGLRRTSIGGYKIQNSVQLKRLNEESIKKNIISIQGQSLKKLTDTDKI